MGRIKYFDPLKRQLIYASGEPTADYWNQRWKIDKTIRDRVLKIKDTLVFKVMKEYLRPNDGIILDGGCGWGRSVACLFNNGYKIVGIDFAVETVKLVNKFVPELTIIPGDVKKLPFHDNSFSGYLSLGVIEHFKEGFKDIASEMGRVIKRNGYLFITFPYMSPLRIFKARLGLYKFGDLKSTNNFYQFALNTNYVVGDFEGEGFKLLKSVPHDAVTGLQDEIFLLKRSLKKLLDYSPNYKIAGYIDTLINIILSPLSSHCVLLVFKKCG